MHSNYSQNYNTSGIESNIFIFILNSINALIAIAGWLDLNWIKVAYQNYTIISILILLISLFFKLNNILFLSRTLFIGIIGYYPIVVKSINPDGLFSFYNFDTQNIDLVIKTYLLTNLGLFGNEIGLYLGKFPYNSSRIIKKLTIPLANDFVVQNNCLYNYVLKTNNMYYCLFWLSVPLVLWSSYLTITSSPSVFNAVYASESKGQLLGNLQAIGIIGLLAMVLSIKKTKIKFGKIVFAICAVTFLIWALLFRGLRQDILTATLGMFVVYRIANRKMPFITIKILIISLLAIFIIELWGVVRTTYTTIGFDIPTILQIFITSISNAGGEDVAVYHIGTLSPISHTITNTIAMVDSGNYPMVFGKTIFEFIPRTPPEFIYPNRPQDYAWIFSLAGGFFELAEAYYNFGFIGAFILPLILSYLISNTFWSAFLYQSMFRYFLLFSFLAIWFRGCWYQIFAFYKTGITALIIYYSFIVVYNIITSSSFFLHTTNPKFK